MLEQKKEEIKEFKNQYYSIVYDDKKFRFYIGDSVKYIFGSTTPEDDNSIIGRVSEYRTLYDSLMSTVFCNRKVHSFATKSTQCCHPIFSI